MNKLGWQSVTSPRFSRCHPVGAVAPVRGESFDRDDSEIERVPDLEKRLDGRVMLKERSKCERDIEIEMSLF